MREYHTILVLLKALRLYFPSAEGKSTPHVRACVLFRGSHIRHTFLKGQLCFQAPSRCLRDTQGTFAFIEACHVFSSSPERAQHDPVGCSPRLEQHCLKTPAFWWGNTSRIAKLALICPSSVLSIDAASSPLFKDSFSFPRRKLQVELDTDWERNITVYSYRFDFGNIVKY